MEAPAGGAIVALISWIPLSEGETRVGRDGGGVVELAANLHEDVAQKRSEGIPVGSPEADTPDEIARAGFGEEIVAGVQQLLVEGGDRKLGEVALVNDVISVTFPESLVEVVTEQPRRFCCAGPEEALISLRVAVSPKSLAFSDIMYCSAQL